MTTVSACSSSSTSRFYYHVFLSFRGEDTRRTFTDHLYTALVQAGLRTFRDDDEIRRGENIKLELEKSIQESRISIIVFSKNYASSRWCLDELVMILEWNKRSSGHFVLPVFYDVDPSQVRKQMGSFEDAFNKHEKRFEAEKLKGWREALREVADLAGMNLQDGHEAKFIQNIVQEIEKKLNRSNLYLAPFLIGIESRAKNIISWLHNESAGADIAVICGIGGIGKTTLAIYVYNLNCARFEAKCFLADIREVSAQPGGLVGLQKQLLSCILQKKVPKISNVHEGMSKINNVIGCKRLLVVLDDVDQREQFDEIIGMCDQFHPGSKIILTTRNKHLVIANQVYQIFEVEQLDFNESLEVFSLHAFGGPCPTEGYKHRHSVSIAEYCGGHPLALKILGSSLYGKESIDIWNCTVEKLAAIPNREILKVLKISYDSLDDDVKKLFLYIACFFTWSHKDFAVRILNGCGFYTEVGMDNLIDRCLLTVYNNKLITMHQLLQDMGRAIASPNEELGKSILLWRHDDSFNVMREETGTEIIEALNLDMLVLEKDTSLEHYNTIRPCLKELCDEVLVANQGYSLEPMLPIKNSDSQVELKTEAFKKLHKLKLLLLNYVKIKGEFKDFPKKLCVLSWHGFPLKFIPSDLPLENLVALDLCNSKLERLWKKNKRLASLKILNLAHSHDLIITPYFTDLPNLEDLILKGCINLVKVHKSIGKLKKLGLLNLENCKKLVKLPREICHLTSLEKLIISGCSKLRQLPTELEMMKSLTVFHGDGISTNETPATTVVKLWAWVKLSLLKPRRSQESINFSLAVLPHSLVNLSLSNSNVSTDDLVRSLGSFSMLQDLNLSGNPISIIPESIRGLHRLRSLKSTNCDKLQSLPELPNNLEKLDVTDCGSLEMITNLPNVFTDLELRTRGCEKLVEAQGIFKLEPIVNADPEILKALGVEIDKLETIGSLEVLLVNTYSWTVMKRPLQGLYECGIYNIFLPTSEVPSWCSNNKRKGSNISFKVPSLPNRKIRALNIYFLYEFPPSHIFYVYVYGDESRSFEQKSLQDGFKLTITNETKGLKWTYKPSFRGAPRDKDMVWLSHWKNAYLLMKGGDEMSARVRFRYNWWYESKEIGFKIVYDDELDQEISSQSQDTYPPHSCYDFSDCPPHSCCDFSDYLPCRQIASKIYLSI